MKTLDNNSLTLTVDGRSLNFNFWDFGYPRAWPFFPPISSALNQPLIGGSQSYLPICYRDHIKVSYHQKEPLPADLFNSTVECTRVNNWLRSNKKCKWFSYADFSRHKFPAGTIMPSFADVLEGGQARKLHAKTLEHSIIFLTIPQEFAPGGQDCRLHCMDMLPNQTREVFNYDGAGVIVTVRIRVFHHQKIALDWNHLLISMQWDGVIPQQVHNIPLGSLFAATGALNDYRGSVIGRLPLICKYYGEVGADIHPLPRKETTGYIYLAMPFWKHAKISIQNIGTLNTYKVCAEFIVEKDPGSPESTGYFNIASSYYNDEKSVGWKALVDVQNAWGHIVGIWGETNNLQPHYIGDHPNFRSTEQDILFFTDHSRAATMMGSGLEDYFGFGHEYIQNENLTFSFVGNPYGTPWSQKPGPEGVTRHFYRQQALDPIPFHHSFLMVLEGYVNSSNERQEPISYSTYLLRRQRHQPVLLFLTFYYAKPQTAHMTGDIIHFGDSQSEKSHNFEFTTEVKSPVGGDIFHVTNSKYLGQIINYKVYNATGRVFKYGIVVKFQLRIDPHNKGIILRRDFHSVPVVQWNERAKVKVNGQDQGVWFIAMGTITDKYSLRQEDFILGCHVTTGRRTLEVEIRPLTMWRDISYQAIPIQ